MIIYIYIVLAGILAGFINTLAGSGSAVSLAMLSILGIPIDIANGSNRVAILLQNIIGIKKFKNNNQLNITDNLPLALSAIPGSILGSILATMLDKADFTFILGIIMALIFISLFIKPKSWLEREQTNIKRKFDFKQFVLFFFIGVYGGFIQVGVGIFLLLTLVLYTGHNLIKSNGIKILVIFFLNIPALIIFIYKGLVNWRIGLTLGIGTMIGAWIGANVACKRDSSFTRYILIGVVGFATLKYLGLFDYLGIY